MANNQAEEEAHKLATPAEEEVATPVAEQS